MTVWRALTTTYRGSTAFMIACPLLALIPVVFELLQHVVEVKIGMYNNIATAKATEHHPLRMAFGMVKVLSLIIPAYWVTRFLALGDARRAAAIEAPAVWLFGGVLAFHTAIAAVQLFALPRTVPVTLIAFAVGEVISCLIPAWTVAATLGNAAIGPRRSIAIMAPHMPWTFAVQMLSIIPLMIPHYLLGAAALLAPKLWLWPTLILDALLVGWLSVVMIASAYVTARRAAQAYGVDLGAGTARSGEYAL